MPSYILMRKTTFVAILMLGGLGGAAGGAKQKAAAAPAPRVGEVRTFKAPKPRALYSVAFSPDGSRVLAGSGKSLYVWQTKTGKELMHFGKHALRLAVSPDGRLVATCQVNVGDEWHVVRLWDLEKGRELLQSFKGHQFSAVCVAFSPDGRLVASGSGRRGNQGDRIRIWDPKTFREAASFDLKGGVGAVAFSPDGKRIVAATHNTVRLWDIKAARELRRFKGHRDHVTSASMSPDGRFVLSSSYDKTLRLWDAGTGKELRRLEGHTGWISSAAFSPDGRWILSGAYDKTVRLWNAATGKETHRFEGHQRQVMGVTFSPDGRLGASASWDGTVRLWRLPASQKSIPTTRGATRPATRGARGRGRGAVEPVEHLATTSYARELKLAVAALRSTDPVEVHRAAAIIARSNDASAWAKLQACLVDPKFIEPLERVKIAVGEEGTHIELAHRDLAVLLRIVAEGEPARAIATLQLIVDHKEYRGTYIRDHSGKCWRSILAYRAFKYVRDPSPALLKYYAERLKAKTLPHPLKNGIMEALAAHGTPESIALFEKHLGRHGGGPILLIKHRDNYECVRLLLSINRGATNSGYVRRTLKTFFQDSYSVSRFRPRIPFPLIWPRGAEAQKFVKLLEQYLAKPGNVPLTTEEEWDLRKLITAIKKNAAWKEGDPERIKELVTRLGSDSWAGREKAQKELISAGPGILPLLMKYLHEAWDPEIRQRLEKIIKVSK